MIKTLNNLKKKPMIQVKEDQILYILKKLKQKYYYKNIFQPTKMDKGKKSKITRGGKVKFRTIEEENIVEKNPDEKSK